MDLNFDEKRRKLFLEEKSLYFALRFHLALSKIDIISSNQLSVQASFSANSVGATISESM